VFDFIFRSLRVVLDAIVVQLDGVTAQLTHLDSRITYLDSAFSQLYSQGGLLLSKLTDITDLIAKMNEATNEVASDLAALRAEIVNLLGGISAEGADEVIAQLESIEARLKALGEDPTDPVPPVVPPVE
jgi:CII-binding regulator of phage lambda lysogenization HflD